MNTTGLSDDGIDPALAGCPSQADVDAWAREVAPDLGDRQVADFVLIATELIGNARRHAEGPHLVRLRREGDALRVEVRDRSPSRLPVLGRPDTPTLGSGLVLVNRLSSNWGVECREEHKVVWAEVRTG